MAATTEPTPEPTRNSTSIDVEKAPPPQPEQKDGDDEFPTFRKLVFILIAIYLSMFIVALDRTILGTAIPKITDDFHAITDVGWYGSAYLLTSCAFQLIYGRIYAFYSAKNVLLVAIVIFEVGSAVCGAAPSSKAFIVGRAIAGLGSAGIFSGCVVILVLSIPLHKRPMYVGLFGAVFGVASVAGPLVGGAFTSKVSWRWCFYINLPIGAVVIAVLVFILHTPRSKNTDTIKQQMWKLDPFGTLVFLPGIVCLLLALQWGGTTYAWANGRIIALFILAVILIGIFIFIQFRMGERATVPIRIISQRSIASGAFASAMIPGSMMILVYYLPIWFQAIKGVSPVKSGINTIPLVLALVFSSIAGGQLTGRTGYYVPQLIACSVIMSIGAGLITTFKVDTGHATYIGYQVLFGLGLGLGMQQSSMAAQTCLDKKDVTTGVALMFFFQGLGGAIFLSIGEVVFTNSLVKNLQGIAGITAAEIVHSGATDLRSIVKPQYLGAVLVAYNKALMDTMYIAVATAVISILSGLTMEWKNIKGMKQGGPSGGHTEEPNQEAGVVSEAARETTNSNTISPELTEVESEGKSAETLAAPEGNEEERGPVPSKK